MIFPATVIATLVGLMLAGGDLRKLGRVRFHNAQLVAIVPLVIQFIFFALPGIPVWILSVIYTASFGALIVFLCKNRRLHGVKLALLGTLSNILVILLNGGRMAASSAAFHTAGLVLRPGEFANTRPVSHATLWFLGDVFAIPSWVPMANVFSIGDVMISVGMVWCMVKVCGTRWSAAALVWHHRDREMWRFKTEGEKTEAC